MENVSTFTTAQTQQGTDPHSVPLLAKYAAQETFNLNRLQFGLLMGHQFYKVSTNLLEASVRSVYFAAGGFLSQGRSNEFFFQWRATWHQTKALGISTVGVFSPAHAVKWTKAFYEQLKANLPKSNIDSVPAAPSAAPSAAPTENAPFPIPTAAKNPQINSAPVQVEETATLTENPSSPLDPNSGKPSEEAGTFNKMGNAQASKKEVVIITEVPVPLIETPAPSLTVSNTPFLEPLDAPGSGEAGSVNVRAPLQAGGQPSIQVNVDNPEGHSFNC